MSARATSGLGDVAHTMRIALLGTRGIPANYGGFETFAEELSTRLAGRGHEVIVYCRERPAHTQYRGVRLQYLPTIRHKYLDTLAHTFLSTLHLLVHRVDVALYCNGANAIFTLWPRIFGMPVALNVDGIEVRLPAVFPTLSSPPSSVRLHRRLAPPRSVRLHAPPHRPRRRRT